MIHRGGMETTREIMDLLRGILAEEPYPSRETLESLDRLFIQKNLSPGGTADLLALVYFLHFLKEEAHE